MSINLRSTRLDSTLQSALQPIPFRPAGLTRQTAAATSTSTQLESSHASFSLSTTGKFMLGARVFSACVGACECLSVCLSVRSLSAETGAPKSYGKKTKKHSRADQLVANGVLSPACAELRRQLEHLRHFNNGQTNDHDLFVLYIKTSCRRAAATICPAPLLPL